MGKLGALFRLTRFEHSILLIIAVIGAEILAGGLPSAQVAALSIITPIFLSMSAFAINDYFDVNVDRANKKKRPLVTRELRPSDALAVASVSMVIGIAGGLLLNAYCFIIAVIFGVLSILYSYKLKDVPLIGNSYVAFSMAIPFVFGNYVMTYRLLDSVVLIFFLIFISGLGREIYGTIRDFDGDKKRGAMTVPMLIGKKASAYLGLLLYLAAVAISVYLFLHVLPFAGNILYVSLILISDFMLVLSSIPFMLANRNWYGYARNLSLGAMGLALLCILLSAVIYV